MEMKKRIKTILIGLLLAGSIVGFGYGMSTAVKPYDPGRIYRRRHRFRDPHGAG